MHKFSTVKNALQFLELKTKTTWDSKFEMLHGKRFYFVWRVDILPLNQRQWTLVCRGDKQTVLAKLERIANAPTLPIFV